MTIRASKQAKSATKLAEKNLATESEAYDLVAPQALPQAPFGARRIASEASGKSR